MDRIAVKIIREKTEAELLTDPMRREILRLLAKESLTEHELSHILGLSPPSVGYHLKALVKKNLISVVRKEPEEHGIVEKFYRTKALVHIIDFDRMPLHIRRYLMPNQLERVRGMLAGLSMDKANRFTISSESMEKVATSLAGIIVNVAEKYTGSPASGDPEVLINSLYREALRELSREDLAPRLRTHA
jgi:DNA-binding transcriptional ArsR family regulator